MFVSRNKFFYAQVVMISEKIIFLSALTNQDQRWSMASG